jgi:hypothetical protein
MKFDMEFVAAYADTWDEGFAEELRSSKWGEIAEQMKRNLDWRGKRWMTPSEWEEQAAEIVPGYNDFDPHVVGEWLSGFSGIMVQPAREASVALYVKGPRATLEKMKRRAGSEASADEADIQEDGELRLWWD